MDWDQAEYRTFVCLSHPGLRGGRLSLVPAYGDPRRESAKVVALPAWSLKRESRLSLRRRSSPLHGKDPKRQANHRTTNRQPERRTVNCEPVPLYQRTVELYL